MRYRHVWSLVLCTLLMSACGHSSRIGPSYDDDIYGDKGGSYWSSEDRTYHRTVLGDILYPRWLTQKPEHYEFLPLNSNHDPQNSHPAQWAGQEWDPSQWDGKDWTPESTIKRLYAVRVLSRQYLEQGVAVLELGPRFWKLSDLDRRRVVKLVADTYHAFDNGHQMIVLRDWQTHDNLGTYTPQGMFLN